MEIERLGLELQVQLAAGMSIEPASLPSDKKIERLDTDDLDEIEKIAN